MVLLSKESELKRLSASLSDMEDLKAKRNRELSSIENEQNSVDAMLRELEKEVAQAEQEIAEAEAAVEKAMEENVSVKKQLEEAKEELTQIRLLCGAAASERSNAEQMLARIRGDIEEYEGKLPNERSAAALLGEKDGSLRTMKSRWDFWRKRNR